MRLIHPLCPMGAEAIPVSSLDSGIGKTANGQCPYCNALGVEFMVDDPWEYIRFNYDNLRGYPPFRAFGPLFGMHNVRESNSYVSSLTKYDDGIGGEVAYKFDYLLPSKSFKYREAVAICHIAKVLEVDRIIATSSGNTAAALRLCQKNSEILSLDLFEWGPHKSYTFRSAAQAAAGERYLAVNNPKTTLFVNGSRNPMRLLGHEILGCELLLQLAPWNTGTWHYFQATGSGYGCLGIDTVSGGLLRTHRVRPVREVDAYAPALTDPPMRNDLIEICTDKIQAAYEFLAPNFEGVGLEAACALAGYWAWRQTHPELNCVINLTGALKGAPLPWSTKP